MIRAHLSHSLVNILIVYNNTPTGLKQRQAIV